MQRWLDCDPCSIMEGKPVRLSWENLQGFLSELLWAEEHLDVCGYTAYIAAAPDTGNCLLTGTNVVFFSPLPCIVTF